MVALSIPVGVYLTMIGGILFGAVLGGVAAVIGATIGAVLHLPDRQERARRIPRAPGGSAAEKMAQGFRADAFSYLLFLRLVPIFPFWLVNLVPALCGVRAGDLRGGDRRSASFRRRSPLPSSAPVSTA